MTEPHFIRCVVPNTHKQPGGVEPELVMHQYKCNGVLAGIAICRKGFPNKMLYPEFKARYNILAAAAVAKAKNDKAAAGAVMDIVKMEKEKFRLGHTKVFFRAGQLGKMEEIREDRIGAVLAWLQSGARGKASRMHFKKLQDQKLALYACQRAISMFMTAKTWKWMQIWLLIKPNLKCTQFGKYKKEYEDKIALAEANIDKAFADREKVQAVHDGLLGQKNEVSLALTSGGSAVQDIIAKTVRIENMTAEVKKELEDVKKRIKSEKDQKNSLEQQMSKTNAAVSQLENEVSTLEGVLTSSEQHRANKDNQIRTLKDEVTHQTEMIGKLGKEKRSGNDSKQKTEEDIQAAEDKCNHLSRVKGKLEQALDEAEDSLEREKKVKGDVEKAKRKVEGDLKMTQEAINDLNRAKAEKNRSLLKKDIEDVSARLDEAGSNTATQVELNKKREAELARIRGELEQLNIAHESTLAALRLKHNNSMSELGEQIDNLNSSKMKGEKDKTNMERDLGDARATLEETIKAKSEIDKQAKLIQGSIVDANNRLDDLSRNLNEAESSKKRLDVENQDLNRQIEELEAACAQTSKAKSSATTQLEDMKALGDGEAKDKASLLTKYKSMSTDLANLREKIENENIRKSDAMKALSKAAAEIQLLRSRYETEGMGRIEELEAGRSKLQSRIVEAEETVDSLQTKIANVEKARARLNTELEEMAMDYERVHAATLIAEKRSKNFEKIHGEWQSKAY